MDTQLVRQDDVSEAGADVGAQDAVAETAWLKAQAYPLDPVIARYRKDSGLPDDVIALHEHEFRRFFALIAMAPERRYGIHSAMDDLWHTFLLFTREYKTFCSEVVGYFVHHCPEQSADVSKEELAAGYQLFLSDYERIFGEEPPTSVWIRPMTEHLNAQTSNLMCSSCACGHTVEL